jgi:flavodoxin/Pyruvate/2-oxoacid:ferredoxin oxidoreductase delta subunit
MSKILMVYFSQGGTTAQIAELIAIGLKASCHEVDLCNLKDGPPQSLDGYDLLGIGTPAYYFRPSFNIMDYVKSLPHLDGLPAFVFVLYGTYLGETGNDIRHALSMKGAKEIGYFKSLGADFYQAYLKEGYLFSAIHPTANELTEAKEFGINIDRIIGGEKYIHPEFDPPPSIMYRLERFFMNEWLVTEVYSRLFSINRKKCTRCHLCMSQCPAENITTSKAGHPVWNRHCLFCLSCEMHCPQEAITSIISWPIFHPVIRYNVSHASQDTELDYVKVKHIQGITIRE